MNAFIQKAAEFLGIATERVSQMTEHETKQLESAGEQISAVETEKENALAKIIILESVIAANETDLQAKDEELARVNQDLQVSQESLVSKDSVIAEMQSTIEAKDAKIAELEETIANLPGASDTKVKVGEEKMHTTVKKDDAPKYWTSADAELAEFQSKFKKKTTK